MLDPRINVPEGWRLMTVPVTVGSPAELIVPAAKKTEGFVIEVQPATVSAVVMVRIGNEVSSNIVALPEATAPERPRLILRAIKH